MKKGWNLDKQEWCDLERLIDSLEWKRVPFHESFDDQVPSTSGVYMICGNTPFLSAFPFSEFHNVLYVGLSRTSLKNRFRTHCMRPDVNIKSAKALYGYVSNKMRYYFAKVSADKVDVLEGRLIDCFGPPSNRQSGSVRGRVRSSKPAG